MPARWLCGLAAFAALPAAAQDQTERDYCPERPGINTPPCVIAPGRVSVETSLADWTFDRDGGARSDTVLVGDTVVRFGVTDTVEGQIGWTPFGHVRDRTPGGGVSVADRVGDVTLGVKANLQNPDGGAFSIAVLPFVTLPVGRTPIGAGDWGAGLLLPIAYSLSDRWSLAATPEIDAAVDGDGRGRHLAYSLAGGLSYTATDALSITGELQALRDDDPAGGDTSSVAALSFAYALDKDTQVDLFGATGLSGGAPDGQLYVGIARRF